MPYGVVPVSPYAFPAYPFGYDLAPSYGDGYGQLDTTTEWYCASADRYFPDLTSCPEGWQEVEVAR